MFEKISRHTQLILQSNRKTWVEGNLRFNLSDTCQYPCTVRTLSPFLSRCMIDRVWVFTHGKLYSVKTLEDDVNFFSSLVRNLTIGRVTRVHKTPLTIIVNTVLIFSFDGPSLS